MERYPINPGEPDYVGVTLADGRFTMIDGRFGSEPFVDLIAKAPAPDEREIEGRAFEDPGLFAEFVRVPRFNRTGDVVFNFPLSASPSPPTSIDVRLYRVDGENQVEIRNGIVAVNEEIDIKAGFSEPPGPANLSINGVPVTLRQLDELNFEAEFTPTEVRSHTLELTAFDAFLNPLQVTKSFLVVLAGAGNGEALDGRPTIISDSAVPRDGEEGVSLNQTLSVLFSEPVSNVTPSSVLLREKASGRLLSLDLTGTLGAGNTFDPLHSIDFISALTIEVTEGLVFGTEYVLEFTDDIHDRDDTELGAPEPSRLVPVSLEFRSFSPEGLTDASLESSRAVVATLGNRAFIATQSPTDDGSFGKLVTYDMTDPTEAVRIGPEDSTYVGSIVVDAESEVGLDLGAGTKDVVAVLSIIPFSGNSNITLFDVAGTPPFAYETIFTTTIIGQGAVADMALDGGFAYVAATAGGLRIYDLVEAANLYRQTNPPGPTWMSFEVSRGLFTKGMGFGLSANVAAVPVTEGATSLWVTSVAVGETAEGRRAVVGAYDPTQTVARFSTVNVDNPFAPFVLATIPLEIALPGLDPISMSYVRRVELTNVNGRHLAVAVGSGVSEGRLAVIDIEQPSNPVLTAIIGLDGGAAGSVVFTGDGTTALIGTSGGVEGVNLADPDSPRSTGIVSTRNADLGELALVGGDVLVSVGQEGLNLTALSAIPVIGTDPPVLVTNDALQVLHPGRFVLGSIPKSFEVSSAEVVLSSGEQVQQVLPVPHFADGVGTAPFDVGFVLPQPVPGSQEKLDPGMSLVLNRSLAKEKVSNRKKIAFTPLLHNVSTEVKVALEYDPRNDISCIRSADSIEFSLALGAEVNVFLTIDGVETQIFSGELPASSNTSWHQVRLEPQATLIPPRDADHRFRVVAEIPGDPASRVERDGDVKVSANTYTVLPVGHTFVKGVDLLDGHMVVSATDVRIPGRIPLEITRTYGSSGRSDEGLMGAQWSFNYTSRLIVTDCVYTIVGGDGSGQRFQRIGNEFVPPKGYHTRLVQNGEASYDFFTKGGIKYHYEGVPRIEGGPFFKGRPNLAYIEDTNGNKVRIEYDEAGLITEVYEEERDGTKGRSLYFSYTDEPIRGERRIETVTGPMNLLIGYEYDAFANLVEVTRSIKVERYEYTVPALPPGETSYPLDMIANLDLHNMTAVIDANGNRTEYVYYTEDDEFPGEGDYLSYGKFEWVKEVREAVGQPELATTSFVYDLTELASTGRFITRVTDPRMNATIYRLNANGSPLEIEEPGGVLTVMEWAADDIYKEKEIDAEGRETWFEYDANANLIKETIKDVEVGGEVIDVITTFDYDPNFNKMKYKQDAEGRETFFEINETNGNLDWVRDAEGNVTSYGYKPNGDLETVTGPRPNQITRYTYDKNGNPDRIYDALGNVIDEGYDDRSRLRSRSDSFGRRMALDYDALDRLQRKIRFDDGGSSDNEDLWMTYHPNGELKTETKPNMGLVTTYHLDGLNRVNEIKQELEGEELVTRMSYDGNGNLEEKTDRRDVKTINQYDELNRLEQVEVEGPFGPRQVVSSYEYDKVGNKRFEWDIHGGMTEFVYDGLYRVVRKVLPKTPYVEEFSYDLVGNKLSETDANGHVTTYEYDSLNRVELRIDAEENHFVYDYDEVGNQILEEDVTRGLETVIEYDHLNRPKRRLVTSQADGISYETLFNYRDSSHTVVETDPRDYVRTTVLDGLDRVHQVSQETGGEILVTTQFYDANGNVKRIVDAENRTTEFDYDGLSRLRETRYPLGLTSSIEYDGEGNKISETNRRNLTTHYTYDNLGRPLETSIEQPITTTGGQDHLVVAKIEYNDANRIRMETDARGHTTTYELDELNRVKKITDPLHNYQEFTYDGVNKRSERDKRGFWTHYDYDELNRLEKVTDTYNKTILTDYRDAERQVVETDKKQLVKTTQLDGLGRLVSVTRSGVVLEQHEYDENSNRVLSTDAKGNKTKFDYDGANRLIARTDGFESPLATTTTFEYDKVGNLLEEKDGRLTGSDFDVKNTYDALNRLETVTDGEGNVTTYEYDGEGNRKAVVEPRGESYRTEYDYGEMNELLEVRMADGAVFHYTYDENRNRIEQTDGEGNVVTFEYDELNRLDLMTQDPDGFAYVTDHDYDPNGNETMLTDPKGQVIDYTYDDLSRLETKVFNLTQDDLDLYTRTHSIVYHYDDNNNLEQVDELRSSGTDPPAVVSSYKTYDDLDRLETETDSFNKTLTYGYDDVGNRTLLLDPDGKRTVYDYDELNRLETVKLDEGTADEQLISYQYYPDGLKKTVTNPNNTVSNYGYDDADRLESISHTGPAGVISSYVYGYDPSGNRQYQLETNAGRTETTSYTYDFVNRLETVTYEDGTANAKTTTYTYDKAGNRLTEQEVELATANILKDLTYDYDEINRLETITANIDAAQNVAYSYDANGNTLSKTKDSVTTTFKYDIRDQLGEVQQGSNILGRYGYDYEGLRILKIGDDGIRRYTYDQLSVITEADDSDATVSKYDYGLDQLVSLNNRVEGRSFFHLDILRSTVSLTDPSGSARQSILYDAWGNERDRIGASANKFTFTGHELDEETDLIYAKARFYDADIGRFLSQDSYLGEIVNPPSLHRYYYAYENPLLFLDPTGMQSLKTLAEKEKERRRANAGTSVPLVTDQGFESGRLRLEDPDAVEVKPNRPDLTKSILTPDEIRSIHTRVREEIRNGSKEGFVVVERHGGDRSASTTVKYVLKAGVVTLFVHLPNAVGQLGGEKGRGIGPGLINPNEEGVYSDKRRQAAAALGEEQADIVAPDIAGEFQEDLSDIGEVGGQEAGKYIVQAGVVKAVVVVGSTFVIVPGKVIGSGFSKAEREIAEFLANRGQIVEAIPRSRVAGKRTADFLVNGVQAELKTASKGGTINQFLNQVLRGKGQARNIIIDARNADITRAEAAKRLQRVVESDFTTGKIDSVEVILKDGTSLFLGPI